jgi:hypothetical protein
MDCTMCPAGDKHIDTQTPTSSWLIKKMEPFVPGTTTTTMKTTCGDAMPTYNTTGTNT